MADLAAFVEPGFDPVAWINAQCKDKLGDDGLERFLSELEMRLLLAGEEIEATLTDSSSAALRRIPYAQQEVSRLRADISALQVGSCVPPCQLNHQRQLLWWPAAGLLLPKGQAVLAETSISRCRQHHSKDRPCRRTAAHTLHLTRPSTSSATPGAAPG
jgi:hypothetical protein